MDVHVNRVYFWLLIIPLIDSSFECDSNGCQIIKIDENHVGVIFWALKADISAYNLISNGDY